MREMDMVVYFPLRLTRKERKRLENLDILVMTTIRIAAFWSAIILSGALQRGDFYKTSPSGV